MEGGSAQREGTGVLQNHYRGTDPITAGGWGHSAGRSLAAASFYAITRNTLGRSSSCACSKRETGSRIFWSRPFRRNRAAAVTVDLSASDSLQGRTRVRALTDCQRSVSRRSRFSRESTARPLDSLGDFSKCWLRGRDLNPRPLGYEPNELPDCSTPRQGAGRNFRVR